MMAIRPLVAFALPALLGLAGSSVLGQAPPSDRPLPPAQSFAVAPAAGPIRVDGALDDTAWARADSIPLDWEWTPGDNAAPPVRSVCRITYDESNLYVGCRGF